MCAECVRSLNHRTCNRSVVGIQLTLSNQGSHKRNMIIELSYTGCQSFRYEKMCDNKQRRSINPLNVFQSSKSQNNPNQKKTKKGIVEFKNNRQIERAMPKDVKKQKLLIQDDLERVANSRRETILFGANFGVILSIATQNDATTIVNSVLSGYFLPTFGLTAGFKVYDDFDNDYVFEYPRAWVARDNSLRDGIYVSNFQTADKATVDIFSVDGTSQEELSQIVVQKIIAPAYGQEDDKLNMPNRKLVRSQTQNLENQDYLYLQFPSETITRSGYQVRRKNFAVATIKRGKVYCLNASARTDQFNKDKEELLQHIIQSFRVR
eukprot:TRINITY_DN28562_c0_g1_i2.p1 TRINITY_DN28562_c0_g1~~TRINITY_DN28562_c0_g1_i2.p1  ORF type:complete len:371 (+),score=24.16 TRINITY_DN28562_c0_g1_i2:150-1115(+)